MSRWPKRKLGDISDTCLGKMLDVKKNKGEFEPYLANINVRWGKFDFSNLNKMRFEASEQERYGLKYGDLVICEGGEPGRCAIWKDEVHGMKIQKALHRVRVHSSYNNEFVYYRLLLAGSSGELNKHFIGSTIKHLTGIGLKQVEFSYPPIEEQEKIAAVLSALDAKVDCNNRINAELEVMSKTLYDYWFVQFDFPDANGKPYKTSGGKMIFNHVLKREIPVGWKDDTLDDIGRIVGGSTPTTSDSKNFTDKGTPWITPKDLSDNLGNKFITRGEQDVTNQGIKDASLKIHPKGTVLLSSRAPIGYMAIARGEITTNQGFKSFIPSKNFSSAFIYYAVKRALKAIIQYASGSTFKEVSGSVLKTVKVCLPDTELIAQFTNAVEPIIRRQDLLEQENQQLLELREWLLPMLMNGQITASSQDKHQQKHIVKGIHA